MTGSSGPPRPRAGELLARFRLWPTRFTKPGSLLLPTTRFAVPDTEPVKGVPALVTPTPGLIQLTPKVAVPASRSRETAVGDRPGVPEVTARMLLRTSATAWLVERLSTEVCQRPVARVWSTWMRTVLS